MMKLANYLLVAAGLTAAVACGGGDKREQPMPKAPAAQPGPRATTGSVSGRLTDRVTSLPLAQVAVFAHDASAGAVLSGGALGSAVTQADGTFTIPGLPLGQPLRVASQPSTGGVHYQTAVTAPLILLEGVDPEKLNLAFGAVTLGGAVEGHVPRQDPAWPSAKVELVHDAPAPGGKSTYAVVRRMVPEHGAFRFESLEPGVYYVLYTLSRETTTPLPDGLAHSSSTSRWATSVVVKAGGTSHAVFTKSKAPGAATAHR